jgi:hypothetical protein
LCPLAAIIAVSFRICGIVSLAHPALPGQRAFSPIHGCEPSAFALCYRLASMMRTRHPLQVGLLPVFPEKAAFLGLLPFNNPNGNTASLGADCQTLTQTRMCKQRIDAADPLGCQLFAHAVLGFGPDNAVGCCGVDAMSASHVRAQATETQGLQKISLAGVHEDPIVLQSTSSLAQYSLRAHTYRGFRSTQAIVSCY